MSDARRQARWWLKARLQSLAKRKGLVAGWTILWTPGGRSELVPVEVAEAGRGEVTLEVHHSVVSPGTERAQYLGLPNARIEYPYRPGYSAAGVVTAVGAGVTGLRPGDRVAAIGLSHASVGTVPAESTFAVPEGADLRDAALIRLGIIAAQGVRLARLRPGESVCVLGAGLVGLLAQRLATAAGAGKTTVVARSRAKEGKARAGGSDEFVVSEGDGSELEQLGAAVVIEATGDPGALALAVAAAGPGGRIVLLGSPRGTAPRVPLERIREKGLRIVGAHVGTLGLERAATGQSVERGLGEEFLRRLADGSVSVADLFDVVVDPREAGAFYRELARSREIVGAAFDWLRLEPEYRVERAPLLRRPDLSGRGVEFRMRPLGAAGVVGEDPFAGATGRLGIGLLGCGDIAVRNAAAAVAAPNTSLVACFDPVTALAEDVAATYGCESAPAAEALFERKDVDAIFLSVPHHLHAPLAMEAAAAGKHVIVEKPPANDLRSAVEMAAAAERAGVRLTICFPHRYDPRSVHAVRLIEAGALGEFAGASVSFLSDKPASYWLGGFSGRAVSDWRTSREKAGGGVLIMNLSHYVDLVRRFAGVEAETVTALAGQVDSPGEVEDTVSIAVGYGNGAVGSVFGCTTARGIPGTTELHVWGREGYLVVESDPRVYTTRAVAGVRPGRWQALGPLPKTNIRAVFLSRFASALDRGVEPDVSPADGLAVQAFMEAAYRSIERGSAVSPRELLVEAYA